MRTRPLMICLLASACLLQAVAATGQTQPAASQPAMTKAEGDHHVEMEQRAAKMAEAKARATLHVGDPAPALNVQRWIKGEPVPAFQPGTIYVVDFWATWCGPCVASIPDITWLAKKFPSVVFIGIDCRETDSGAVDAFVKEMGDRMAYRVAADSSPEEFKAGPMAKAWLTAAATDGIPSFFVVDGQGKIAAIDGDLLPILGAMTTGRPAPRGLSVEADQKVWRLLNVDYSDATIAMDWPAALRVLDQIDAIFQSENVPIPEPGWRPSLLIAAKRIKEAEPIVAKFEAHAASGELQPSKVKQAGMLELQLHAAQNDALALNRQAEALSRQFADDASFLTNLAYALTDGPVGEGMHLANVDLFLVIRIAEQADQTAGGTNAFTLDTLARAHALRGEFDRAIAVEQKAIACERYDTYKPDMQKTLEQYQRHTVN